MDLVMLPFSVKKAQLLKIYRNVRTQVISDVHQLP